MSIYSTNAQKYLEMPVKGIATLQTTFDHGKLIKDAFTQQSQGQIISLINEMGKKVDNFQIKLSDYFYKLAIFDRSKAEYDYEDAKSLFEDHQETIRINTAIVTNKLRDIFIMAFTMGTVELYERAATLAAIVASKLNPLSWLVADAHAQCSRYRRRSKRFNEG